MNALDDWGNKLDSKQHKHTHRAISGKTRRVKSVPYIPEDVKVTSLYHWSEGRHDFLRHCLIKILFFFFQNKSSLGFGISSHVYLFWPCLVSRMRNLFSLDGWGVWSMCFTSADFSNKVHEHPSLCFLSPFCPDFKWKRTTFVVFRVSVYMKEGIGATKNAD